MSPSGWNGEMIDKVFWPVDRGLVWGIPLSAGEGLMLINGVLDVGNLWRIALTPCGCVWKRKRCGKKLFNGRFSMLFWEGKKPEPVVTMERAGRLWGEFLACNGLDKGAMSRRLFGRFSPHLGECFAAREGAWFACS
ncbi:hypothetical protein TIFTF001_035758 [Ficus carica]|uniref:Uncharacterized protein n=1 Tax=Ficus carica TaxID=3494 RepID=A0AA88EBD6_FICCA|nr:hypothetical protein TIFTF001_035758 [Ficus carica]